MNADELKLRLIEAWFGIQQSVGDQAMDQWRVHLNACVKAKEKNFEKHAMMCCSTSVNNVMKLTFSYFLFHNF